MSIRKSSLRVSRDDERCGCGGSHSWSASPPWGWSSLPAASRVSWPWRVSSRTSCPPCLTSSGRRLTSLRQLTELLLDGRVVAEDRRETYYRAAARQTERLHRLVEGLLDFGRMEAGTSPYRMAPIDACALVRSVVDEFEQDSAASGYHVELQVDGFEGATPVVAGDREALTHAVWNLLDNAVKYSLTCRTVWVDVVHAGSRLNIRVRDRGLGIPTHEHRDVFKRFVRGAGAKVHGIRGTGVGLAMVRHIVSAHGGEVDIESREGMGSTFTIVLPLQEGSAGLRATATRAPEPRGLEREA